MNRMTWTIAAFTLIGCMALAAPWSAGPVETALAAQKTCPVMGFEVNRNIFTDFQGKRIYFCCQSCPPEFRKNPEAHMAKMKADGVLPEDAPVKTP